MSRECWLEKEVWDERVPDEWKNRPREMRQCCCNCIFHFKDRLHPSIDKEKYYASEDKHKGYICGVGLHGDWNTNETKSVAISGWDEHSIGCEMYTERNKYIITIREKTIEELQREEAKKVVDDMMGK